MYNDSSSKEIKKPENLNTSCSNNILIIFLNSVSLVSSLIHLNKALKFIEKFISY